MYEFRCSLAGWLCAWVNILGTLIYIITFTKVDIMEYPKVGCSFTDYIYDKVCRD